MTAKKKHSTGRSIWKWLELIPCFLRLFRGTLYKLKLETCFAIKNIVILLVLSLMLACLLTATWISLLAVLFFGLLEHQWTWQAAAVLVMSVNLIGFLLLIIGISRIKNKLLSINVMRDLADRQ